MIRKTILGMFLIFVAAFSHASCTQLSLPSNQSNTNTASVAAIGTSTVTTSADACFSYSAYAPGTSRLVMENSLVGNAPYRIVVKDGATTLYDHVVTSLVEAQQITTSGAGNYTLTVGSINPYRLPARVDVTAAQTSTGGQSFIVSVNEKATGGTTSGGSNPPCQATNSCGGGGGPIFIPN